MFLMYSRFAFSRDLKNGSFMTADFKHALRDSFIHFFIHLFTYSRLLTKIKSK